MKTVALMTSRVERIVVQLWKMSNSVTVVLV
jgi:hypothetical protein